MRLLTYFIAVSQDGFIAGPDGEIDRFEQGPELIAHIAEHFPDTLPTPFRGQLGIEAAPREFDCVLMGRNTYQVGADLGLVSPYAHLPQQVVFSSSLRSSPTPDVTLVPANPVAYVRDLKKTSGRGIWLCGGGLLAGALQMEIDRLILKRQPLVLGAGRPLFAGEYGPVGFELSERITVGKVTFETFERET